MKGSDFLAKYKGLGLSAWEKAALEMAKRGENVQWSFSPVTIQDKSHTLTIYVADDYFSIGEDDDVLRLPLTPLVAQEIANLNGYLLPTPKLVYDIHKAAVTKVNPKGMTPNKGADLQQYADHNDKVVAQLPSDPGLTSGQKKDVVVGNQWKPGKLLIYGWFQPNAPLQGKDPAPMMTGSAVNWGYRVQPYSPGHGDFYVDYSHGIRFINGVAELDGQEVDLTKIYQDPQLASLVSDEGPVKNPRYPAKTTPAAPTKPIGLAELGAEELSRMQAKE